MEVDNGSSVDNNLGGSGMSDRTDSDGGSSVSSDNIDEYQPSETAHSEGTEGTQAYDSPDRTLKSNVRSQPGKQKQPSGTRRVKEMPSSLKFRIEHKGGKEIMVVDWDEDDDGIDEPAKENFAGKTSTSRRYQAPSTQSKVSSQFGLCLNVNLLVVKSQSGSPAEQRSHTLQGDNIDVEGNLGHKVSEPCSDDSDRTSIMLTNLDVPTPSP